MGSGPMPKQDEYKEIARAVLAHTAGLLALAERWLRRADQLGYVVRRRLIPIPFEKATRSMPHKEASILRSGLSSDIQAAIGQRLRAEYALERSMPARLANLLKEFEQRNNTPEAFARDGFASAA
jgi:hypothetical protein